MLKRYSIQLLLLMSLSYLSACGGAPNSSEWVENDYPDSSLFKNRCANPRSGDFLDKFVGSEHLEKMWLRSWSNDTYLWYNEIVDTNPEGYDVIDYFNILTTDQLTSSGADKDNFHFSVNTEEWESRIGSGESTGYGAEFLINNQADPRTVTVFNTEPNSPATASAVNMQRGTRILSIDGVDINSREEQGIAILNAGLFPTVLNQTHSMTIQNLNEDQPRTISISATTVTSTPVQHVTTIDTATGKVGYMLFNDHIATAEAGLVNAIADLADENITDLVLDVRYNGGGYLAIASQLSYMIAGSAATNNKTFERIRFNDKHLATNPVTGANLSPTPFYDITLNFSFAYGQALPSLNLPRVFILTTSDTCSASESIINGLRGIGVEVIQIGDTTCGKPYGFYDTDNCGTTYFTIQFQGSNHLGFGEYSDGFTPVNSTDITATAVPGCAIADDLTHDFADPDEALLSAALYYRENNSCPTDTADVILTKRNQNTQGLGDTNIPEWRKAKILR